MADHRAGFPDTSALREAGGDLTSAQCDVRVKAAVDVVTQVYERRITAIRGFADSIKSA